MADPRILPNRIELRPGRGIPLDRLRPVVVRDGRPIRLAIRARRVEPDDGSGPALVVDADLRPFAVDRRARLQVWADGFKLSDTALFPGGATVTGAIERIVDYCVTGWAAEIVAGSLPKGVVLVDGKPCAPCVADIGRRDLAGLAPLDTCAGFAAPLPAAALDGREHEIAVAFGACRLGPIRFRSRPRLTIDHADAQRGLKLSFYDEGQPDGPVTITLRAADGRVLVTQVTHARADTGERLGRWFTGFARPLTALRSEPRIDICVGRAASLVVATLRVTTPAATLGAMRAAAAVLLRIEREHGRPIGWSRDLIGGLRATSGLAAATASHMRLVSIPLARRVSVVVPIFKGVAETEACIGSLLRAVADGDDDVAEILLLDDAAPEPLMATLLGSLPATVGACALRVMRNTDNLGFVATANLGLASADPAHDVILLNSDTVVPSGFVARLKAAAHSAIGIASATPLSNDATVLSVPRVDRRNALVAVDTAELDAVLMARGGPTTADIPVGHGFCLYLKREALDDVGAFDPAWGRGYGEEVDWCLRARDRGWTHVAALDTYVHHTSSTSFGAAERERLIAVNQAVLEGTYPDFVPELRAFLAADALAPARLDVFCHLLARAPARCLLHITHAMGGGTAVLVERYAAAHAQAGGINLIVSGVRDTWLGVTMDEIVWREADLSLRLPTGGAATVLDRLVAMGLPELRAIVHSIAGAPDVARELGARWAIPYVVCAHDYQWVCPRVTLVDQTDRYCGLPEPRYCQLCVRANDIYDFGDAGNAAIARDIPAWLASNRALLAGAVATVAPSADTAHRLAGRLDLPRIAVVAHPEPVAHGVIRPAPGGATLRVAVVGGITIAKGLRVLSDLAGAIDRVGAPVRIKVFGDVADIEAFARQGAIELGGRYAAADLPGLLEAWEPHYVFFPAVWPETYCFVLSEVWAAGYPVVAFDIGAINERVRATGGGIVLPFEPDAELLLARLLAVRVETAACAGRVVQIGPPMPADAPIVERLFQR